MTPTPWHKSTHYSVVASPEAARGYKLGEPRWIVCEACGARETITPDPSAGVDDMEHKPDCSQRFSKSEWYREQLEASD